MKSLLGEVKMRVATGLAKLRANKVDHSGWGNIGLVANQASVDFDYMPAWKVASEVFGSRLVALFGPQHGFESTVQDNMIETSHETHLYTGLPLYSLYSETRAPTGDMLQNVDTILIDLQITGCRVYTFKWTIAECLRSAKKYGKNVVVLDRPNPIGGEAIEGRVAENNRFSFVAQDRIPMRHGLTPAELAKFVNRNIGAELETVALENWDPASFFGETGLPWVITSPNMPSLDTVTVFPGTVIFEGTNISEGRGTTLPFQFIGSPFMKNPETLIAYLNQWPRLVEGVHLRPCSFMPTSQKWKDQSCLGIQLHILDQKKVLSYPLSMAICNFFHLQKGFKWVEPGYEYNFKDLPIELIVGDENVTKKFGENFDPFSSYWSEGVQGYIEKVKPYLLYERNMHNLL